METFIVQLANTVFYGSVLFLMAAGLSLIFGVMGILNMAHGGLYAVGAFVAVMLDNWASPHVPPAALFLAIPAAGIAVAAIGAIVEPVFIRPLYNRSEEYPLLITFGLLLIFDDVMLSIWGGLPLSAGQVVEYTGSVRIMDQLYPAYSFVVVGIVALTSLALWAVIFRTRFGTLLRATSQNRKMASALGLSTGKIYTLAFALGCFLAGVAGGVIGLHQTAMLGMGMDALILSFVVVVVGGLGSLKGALAGAFIVSAVRTLGIQFFPELELAALYLIAAGVLLVKPTGLFGEAKS